MGPAIRSWLRAPSAPRDGVRWGIFEILQAGSAVFLYGLLVLSAETGKRPGWAWEVGLNVPDGASGLSAFSSGHGAYGGRQAGRDLAPAGMIRQTMVSLFQVSLRADSGVGATLTVVAVHALGTMDPDYYSLFLFRDDGSVEGVWDASDVSLGVVSGRSAFDATRRAVWTGLVETLGLPFRRYLVAVSLVASAPAGGSVGISLGQAFTVDVPAIAQVFSGVSGLPVVDDPDEVHVRGTSISPVSITQLGTIWAAGLTLFVNSDSALITGLRISLIGDLAVERLRYSLNRRAALTARRRRWPRCRSLRAGFFDYPRRSIDGFDSGNSGGSTAGIRFLTVFIRRRTPWLEIILAPVPGRFGSSDNALNSASLPSLAAGRTPPF